MSNLKIALINIKKNIRNEKELKSSFIISIFGMAINNIAFLILWYYFGKTVGELNGWQPMDVFGLYGFGTTSYGLVCSMFCGILDIPTYITTGNLDKYLLTPKNILVKITTSKIRVSAIGDLLFGIICFIIFAISSRLSFLQILLSIVLILLASIIFYSFSLICMSISFYIMDGHNVSEGIFGMFVGNSLYHGGAFTGVLRIVFIFVMPSLLLGAVPVEIVKTLSASSFILITLLTVFWFILSVLFFYKSLRKYESNNLFGFGS
jgi:ABC-2 type transport system permease protein